MDESTEIIKVVTRFTKDAPVERPEIGDSIGNYDDTFYDGYNAALYDLAEALRIIFNK